MELEKLDDLYDILGVDFGSSDEEINQQYYKRISYFKSKLKKNGKFSGTCASQSPFLNNQNEPCSLCGKIPSEDNCDSKQVV